MHTILIIFKKEMKDLLRNRRTIMSMVVLPLVLVPVIFTLMARVALPSDSSSGVFKNIRVAIQTNGNGAALMEGFQRRKDLDLREGLSPQEINRLVLEDSIDFGLIIDKNFDTQITNGKTGKLELLHKSSRSDTLFYTSFVRTIRDYRKTLIEERLTSIGANTSLLNPTDLKEKNLSPKKNLIGSFAGSLLPVFFVLFCFTGAMYPAIDIITGEKERRTMETLLVLPANRFHILLGKLLVIMTSGFISGLLTFFGIFLFLKLNADLPFISVILTGKAVVLILLMMIPLTAFFAGILIPISIYAKSIKETKRLLQPMILIVLTPAIIGMFPGITLNTTTALIPILNVSLASKDIVGGSIDYSLLALVYLSLFLIAALGVVLAKRWFGDEGNLFRGEG
jgi:sodium transport system permease protein